jgi:large conductance mechanosensitive channel
MLKDFFAFLEEYNVTGLGVAFIMGVATDTLVKSFVNNIIMPLLNPLFVTDSWRDAVWSVGPFEIGLGAFSADLLHFILLAFVVFLVVRRVLMHSKKA